MGVMSSCSLSQTRPSRSRLPGLDQATGRPLNGTRHRPRAHSHSHAPSLNVPSDWLSHRGAHVAPFGPNRYSGRLAARTMTRSTWPCRVALRSIVFFATMDLVSRHYGLRTWPSPTCRQLEQPSISRAGIKSSGSPCAPCVTSEPRARKPLAHYPWPWRATSLLRVPTAHPTSRFTFFGIAYQRGHLCARNAGIRISPAWASDPQLGLVARCGAAT